MEKDEQKSCYLGGILATLMMFFGSSMMSFAGNIYWVAGVGTMSVVAGGLLVAFRSHRRTARKIGRPAQD